MSHNDCTCCRQWRTVDHPSAIDVYEAIREGTYRLDTPQLPRHEDIPPERAITLRSA